jgi:UDP-glucose 4-epimerase
VLGRFEVRSLVRQDSSSNRFCVTKEILLLTSIVKSFLISVSVVVDLVIYMENQHVLITGGTGFVGGWIVQRLVEKHPSVKITIVDVEKRKTWTAPRDDIEFIEADVTKEHEVIAAFEAANPTIVMHTAGIVPTGNNRYRPISPVRQRCYDVNLNGTRHALNAAKAVKAKAFIFTSSVTIISDDVDNDYPNMDETIPTGQATLVYGRVKVHLEYSQIMCLPKALIRLISKRSGSSRAACS